MHFSQPSFLYIALALLLLLPLAVLIRGWRQKHDLQAFASPAMLEKLLAHVSPLRRMLRATAAGIGSFLLVLALAGPQWGSKMVEVKRQGVDVLIALDVSRSMLAEDIKPNRLQRAEQELSALIDKLDGDRVGVIAFAGNAQIVCPLTTDYAAAKMFLNYLTPDSVAMPGTSLGEAIRLGAASFPKGGEGYRVLVLLTDGEDHHSGPVEAAQSAKTAGIKILSIGYGTPAGEPVPMRDDNGRVTGYLKDRAGNSVVSKLDEVLLRQITDITGGAYWTSATGSLDAGRLAELINRMQKRALTSGQYGAYEERYQFVLLPAILLLLFGFWLPLRRRAWLLLFPFLWLAALPAQADVAGDVNAGNRAYQKKNYARALQKYQDAQIQNPNSPAVAYDLGNALHQLGKFQEAEQAYRQALKSPDRRLLARTWYNLGNNFLRQKKISQALQAYQQALALDPQDQDAANNLAVALQEKDQPPPPQGKAPDSAQQNGQGQPGQGQALGQPGAQGTPAQKDGADKKVAVPQKGPDDRGERQADKQAEQTTETGAEEQKPQQPKPGEMSAEDAKNLLDSVRETEQEAQRRRLNGVQDKGRGRWERTEDW